MLFTARRHAQGVRLEFTLTEKLPGNADGVTVDLQIDASATGQPRLRIALISKHATRKPPLKLGPNGRISKVVGLNSPIAAVVAKEVAWLLDQPEPVWLTLPAEEAYKFHRHDMYYLFAGFRVSGFNNAVYAAMPAEYRRDRPNPYDPDLHTKGRDALLEEFDWDVERGTGRCMAFVERRDGSRAAILFVHPDFDGRDDEEADPKVLRLIYGDEEEWFDGEDTEIATVEEAAAFLRQFKSEPTISPELVADLRALQALADHMAERHGARIRVELVDAPKEITSDEDDQS